VEKLPCSTIPQLKQKTEKKKPPGKILIRDQGKTREMNCTQSQARYKDTALKIKGS